MGGLLRADGEFTSGGSPFYFGREAPERGVVRRAEGRKAESNLWTGTDVASAHGQHTFSKKETTRSEGSRKE